MTPFYRFARTVVWLVLRLGFRFEVTGAERVPLSGPLVVACNHVSYLDPPALGVALPRAISYMAKKELFAIPVLGPTISWLSAYPVDREAGGTAALRASLRMLKEGKCVGIFPEGTRNLSGDIKEKSGVAYLGALSGAPVLPAAVTGTRSLGKRKIRVAFGEPLAVTRNRDAGGDDLEKWAAEIMQRVRALEESIR